MKNWTFGKWSCGMGVALLPLAGGCSPQAVAPQEESAITPGAISAEEPGTPGVNRPEAVAQKPTDPAYAPAQRIAGEQPLPPNLRITGPVAEVIKLAESGVAEDIMLSFVDHSSNTFNLGADEIIYLNDIGVPSRVVTAMIQRDQVLTQSSNAAATPVQPAPIYDAAAPTPAEPPAMPPPYSTEPYAAPLPATEAPEVGFYDTLSPYGSWIDVNGYGSCWQPTAAVVNPTWQPYFDCGRWIYSDCGWYWLSDYSWGWAPFHYGRWFRHHQFGWCWRPDRVWGPSWVSWRYSNDYCGWAPLPPAAVFRPGIGLCYGGHAVGVNFNFGLGADCFAFVPFRHFRDHHLHEHAVPRHDAANIYHQTVAVTRMVGHEKTIINDGLAPERVASATRSEVRKVAIRNVESPNVINGDRGERLTAGGTVLTVVHPPLTPSGHRPARAADEYRNERPKSNDTVSSATIGHPTPGRPGRELADLSNPAAGRYPATAPDPTLNRFGQGNARGTDPQVRTGRAPLILRGSDKPNESPRRNADPNAGRATPSLQGNMPRLNQNPSWQLPANRAPQAQADSRPYSWPPPSPIAPRPYVSPSQPASRPAEASRPAPMHSERPRFEGAARTAPRSFSSPSAPSHSAPAPASSPAPSSHSSAPAGGRNNR